VGLTTPRRKDKLVTKKKKRNACGILVGKPEGKISLGRPRLWWVNDIKIDLREIR
jgi:hypothetical protein